MYGAGSLPVLLPRFSAATTDASVVNHPVIPSEETLVPAHAKEQIPIADADITIDMKIDNMMNDFEDWSFQMSTVNVPEYGGYQTAIAYAMEAEHPPCQSPVNIPPPNVPMGRNNQQHPRQYLNPASNVMS